SPEVRSIPALSIMRIPHNRFDQLGRRHSSPDHFGGPLGFFSLLPYPDWARPAGRPALLLPTTSTERHGWHLPCLRGVHACSTVATSSIWRSWSSHSPVQRWANATARLPMQSKPFGNGRSSHPPREFWAISAPRH